MSDKRSTLNNIGLAYKRLLVESKDLFDKDDLMRIKTLIRAQQNVESLSKSDNINEYDLNGINRLWRSLSTAAELCHSIAPDRNIIAAVLLYPLFRIGHITLNDISTTWNDDIATLVEGLENVQNLYSQHGTVASDNFRNLMLTLAKDIRVVIIMIVDRLVVMRALNHHPDQELVQQTAMESGYLYAPLAHRLGLYKIKGELEDLSLKYTNREMFTRIAGKLNATKQARDAYIASFIAQ